MNELIVAFMTGLTAGGLSCLAVQGGLLASSVGHQLEQDLAAAGRRGPRPARGMALPIVLFLAAKLLAYTLLGLLLGAAGSVFQLTPLSRALLLIAVGIFMVGNALRMMEVHPFFRIFAIQPPRAVSRWIRRTARNRPDWFTPLFLGALTVLIPCGVTQAMMAVAVASGSALQGAALMFAFTLGASPVFFAVAYLATGLGARLEKWFMRAVAVVVLALGLVTINSGLALSGSPWSLPWSNAQATEATSPEVAADLVLSARNDGYYPTRLTAPANTPLTLRVVTNQTYSCARAFVIPALRVERILPPSGVVPIEIPPQKAGAVLRFTCSMGMYTGEIVFEEAGG